VLFLVLFPLLDIPFILTVLFAVLPFIVGGLILVGGLELPHSRAKIRGRKIDVNLPYAINYVSAMSSAGVTPTEIFHSLSKQEIYGEIQKEAASIYKDVSILGKDILSAIREAVKLTPSEKFGEFLQGLIVTVTSGGSLKNYFVAKAKQYMTENRQQQRQMIENLGIMAESYVTAAVAGILLMFIVIPVMMIISGDPGQLNFLYIIIFPIVPMIHAGFAYVIRSMTLGVI
ncbi:MAG TPA: secretion system protein, partial [Thermoplasmatales archaeon]|nr:secretion system protein [Thermoplasmatales archaeon]